MTNLWQKKVQYLTPGKSSKDRQRQIAKDQFGTTNRALDAA